MAVTLEVLIPLLFFDKDPVAIFDSNFNRIFKSANSMNITVHEEAKVMKHPVESGITVTDHVVIMPLSIDLSIVLNSFDYPDVYEEIRQFYTNAELITVQTKVASYEDLLIQSLPHDETPDMFDAITIAVKLEQVLFADTSITKVPANVANSDTVNRGAQGNATKVPPSTAVDTARAVGLLK